MNSLFAAGTYVRGYLASDDISTATAIALFDADGIAYVQPVNTRLIIDNVVISNGLTASTVTIFADTNGNGTLDAGEELFSASLAINGFSSLGNDGAVASRRLGTSSKNKLFAVASAASVKTRINLVGRVINS